MAPAGGRAQGSELLRFLAVGAGVTAIQYAAFAALTDWGRLGAPLASGLGYLLGAVISYFANRSITFGSSRSHQAAMLRFALMVGAAWLLTVALMALMVDWLGWNKWLAQFATTAACTVFNYLVARSWVFRSGAA